MTDSLDELRQALRAGDETVRLLVPTATMAQHLQNRLAREGFVLRRAVIQTFSRFVGQWVDTVPQVGDAALYLIVESAVRRVNRPEFAAVAALRGFCASLAGTIAEFSSAGCDSARLAAHLPEAPLSDAFLAVYREVDRELAERGVALRARRLEMAAERIAAEGLGAITCVWLDGFYALPDPELAVIRAMQQHAAVLIRAEAPRPRPALQIVKAAGIERECEEIARRILEQSAAGRPFRDMGIILRNPETYVPVLRAALARFGIPARFYFDAHLNEHAAVRFLCGAVRALLGGWEHGETLAVLRLAPRFAGSAALDRFDFAVRAQVPNAGLPPLQALLHADTMGDERLLQMLESLAALEEWRGLSLTPREWTGRFRTLRNLFQPGQPPDRIGHEMALLHRGQAAALHEFDLALDETAAALGPARSMALADFFRAVESVLRILPLRVPDERREAVHVLSAPEARQWLLPVIFVCGLVEKEFPRFHKQDAFFPDAARCALNQAGIRVRTAAEFEREERALFDAAITRATMSVTLTYPEFDARGERNLPSLYLEDLLEPAETARSVKPRPRRAPAALPPAELRDPALLAELRRRTETVSATSLETYLQCAYQYFGARMLRLKPPPPRPEKRLDFLTQGLIVHEVLREWWVAPQKIEPLFERIFAAALAARHIPWMYHTERLRNGMLDDLLDFVDKDPWPRTDYASRVEVEFNFPLDPGPHIRGKIDRLDQAADGRVFVIDYKYTRKENARAKLTDESLVQAPLYLMAAERCFELKPTGMFYVGLKRGPAYAGWSADGMQNSQPFPENWLPRTAERVVQIVEEIRGGRITVEPADPDKCRFCDLVDACRVQVRQSAPEAAEGA